MTISGQKSRTDWERVQREYDAETPISYDPNDPDDGPYDPNDDAAVEAYFKQATIWRGYPNPVLIQKDGVPVAELTEEEIREAYDTYPAAPGVRKPRSKAS